MNKLTRNDLKQVTISLEAHIVSSRHPAKTGVALYELLTRINGLINSETQKPLAEYQKMYSIVRDTIIKQNEAFEVDQKDGFIDLLYRNDPEKRRIDEQVSKFWAGPVINTIPVVELDSFERLEGTVSVDAGQGGSWEVNLENAYEILVENGIVTIKED